MDSKTLVASLRALNPLNLVVSTEPLDVARSLGKCLGALTQRGQCRAVTRYGIMDIRGYIMGDTLMAVARTKEPPKDRPALETLDEMWREKGTREQWVRGEPTTYDRVLDDVLHQDPLDEQFIYFCPDLWAHLSDLTVLAALVRVRDQREADNRCIKCVFVVVPNLDVVPESFRPLFDVHYDTGLTADEVRVDLVGTPEDGNLGEGGRRAGIWHTGILNHLGYKVEPAELDEMVKQGVGLTTSEVSRMFAFAVVNHVRRRKESSAPFTAEGFADWRKAHGKPAV